MSKEPDNLDNRIRIKPALNRSSSCMTQESQKKERSNEKLQSVLGPVSFTLSDTGTTSNKASVSEAKLRDLLGDVPFSLAENDSHTHRKHKMAREFHKNRLNDAYPAPVSTDQPDEESSLSSSKKAKDILIISSDDENDSVSLLLSPKTADLEKSDNDLSNELTCEGDESNEFLRNKISPSSPIILPSEMNTELSTTISTSPSLLATPTSSNTIFSPIDDIHTNFDANENEKNITIKSNDHNANELISVIRHETNQREESFEIQLEDLSAVTEVNHVKKQASSLVNTGTKKAVMSVISKTKQQCQTLPPKVKKPTPRKRIKAIFYLDPSNRECADCRANLNPHKPEDIFLSFQYPPNFNASSYNSFSYNPFPFPKNLSVQDIWDTRARNCFRIQHNICSPYYSVPPLSYSVFICKVCASAHRKVFQTKTRRLKTILHYPNASVKEYQDIHGQWTPQEIAFLNENKGNAYANNILERHMPSLFKDRITGDSNLNRLDQYYNSSNTTSKNSFSQIELSERLVFVRAKYELFAFALPTGPLSPNTLQINYKGVNMKSKNDILKKNKWLLTIGGSKNEGKSNVSNNHLLKSSVLPSRLVDYFCVVGINGKLDPTFSVSFLDKERQLDQNIKSWENVQMDTEVLDSYPPAKNIDGTSFYPDMNFPQQISKFIFPDGCKPTKKNPEPTFLTFVLTLETGIRIYGASMCIFDEIFDETSMDELKDLVHQIPIDSDDVLYLPKALIVLSHYPYFNVYRSFLQQLYRISRTPSSPLPIERYIANFTREIPLPPCGKVEIRFGFSDEIPLIKIMRPPSNKLPLVDFSYRPLFRFLSIPNILVVFGCLLQETRVVICSSSYSLLTPICESFLSLLFPFVWQGCYIPVMPYDMLDVLEAPFPFLIGIHSRFLEKGEERPKGVVFVDVDKDIVHLGYDDLDPGAKNQTMYGRRTPALPEKAALKLRSRLEDTTKNQFMMTQSNLKGNITYGIDTFMTDSVRENYALSSGLGKFSYLGTSSHHNRPSVRNTNRSNILAKIDLAFRDNESSMPIKEFSTEHGTLSSSVRNTDTMTSKKSSRFSKHKSSKAILLSPDDNDLHDSSDVQFTEAIRGDFLRFFVKIFLNYEKYVIDDKPTSKRGHSPKNNHQDNGRFKCTAFLDQLNIHSNTRGFLSNLLSSQMFERFLEERITNNEHPEVKFFNESITAKINRSKSIHLKHAGKKRETPFLDDESELITDIFHPPAPSNWGLPNDNRTYFYRKFPRLDSKLFGKIRQPKQWKTVRERMRSSIAIEGKALSLLLDDNEALSASFASTAPKWAVKVPKFEERDAEWAIHALSYKITVEKKREKNLSENALGSAEAILMTVRRKQTVMLCCVIKLQSFLRMHRVRKMFIKDKNSIMYLQRRIRYLIIEKKFGRILGHYQFHARKIQLWFRAFLAKREFVMQSNAAIRVQSVIRGFLERNYQRLLLKSSITVQSIVRGRRAILGKKLVLNLLVKAQANIRGHQARVQISKFRRERIDEYREEIVELWKSANVSLEYRSKFWTVVHGDGFLHLGFHEDELDRLRNLLLPDEVSKVLHHDQFLSMQGNFITKSLDNHNKQRSLRLDLMVKQKKSIIFESVPSLSSQNLKDNKHRQNLLSLERLFVYEKLKNSKPTMRAMFYEKFNIFPSEKMKKQKLAEKLWETMEYASESAMIFLQLRNELIQPGHKSISVKKSRKRFGVSFDQVPNLAKSPDHGESESASAFVQSLLEKRIKRSLTQTIHAFINVVQRSSFTANKDEKALLTFIRQRNAALQFSKGEPLVDKRSRYIGKFFNAFDTEIER